MPRQVEGPVPAPGAVYGRLTALHKVRHSVWRWSCTCGVVFDRSHSSVRRSSVMEVACVTCVGAMRADRLVKHGACGRGADRQRHPLYNCWSAMRDRCSNTNNPRYRHYGGRGISVCPRWAEFAVFYADMLPSWEPGLSLDRIDNNGNYTPMNCRWATRVEQANNMSTTVFVAYEGVYAPRQYVAAAIGISNNALASRIARGADITQPNQRKDMK